MDDGGLIKEVEKKKEYHSEERLNEKTDASIMFKESEEKVEDIKLEKTAEGSKVDIVEEASKVKSGAEKESFPNDKINEDIVSEENVELVNQIYVIEEVERKPRKFDWWKFIENSVFAIVFVAYIVLAVIFNETGGVRMKTEVNKKNYVNKVEEGSSYYVIITVPVGRINNSSIKYDNVKLKCNKDEYDMIDSGKDYYVTYYTKFFPRTKGFLTEIGNKDKPKVTTKLSGKH